MEFAATANVIHPSVYFFILSTETDCVKESLYFNIFSLILLHQQKSLGGTTTYICVIYKFKHIKHSFFSNFQYVELVTDQIILFYMCGSL